LADADRRVTIGTARDRPLSTGAFVIGVTGRESPMSQGHKDAGKMKFAVRFLRSGHVVFDMGPTPSAKLVALGWEQAREVSGMSGIGVYAETTCLSPEEREVIARRLVAVMIGGAS
jgi:hypothetical protein